MFPSLYLVNKFIDPTLTIKAIEHQCVYSTISINELFTKTVYIPG